MRKYGIENFEIEEIEEVQDPNLVCEREKYWIEFYGTFKYGYNATTGGDGRPYIDYELVKSYWNSGFTVKEISEIVGCDYGYTSNILDNYISHNERRSRGIERNSKTVAQIDIKTGEIIRMYSSARRAVDALNKNINGSGHITDACNGKRKTAYGYMWKYVS